MTTITLKRRFPVSMKQFESLLILIDMTGGFSAEIKGDVCWSAVPENALQEKYMVKSSAKFPQCGPPVWAQTESSDQHCLKMI